MARLLELEDLPIRINARGEWLHGDQRLHPKVEKLFRRSVALTAAGGYELRIEFRRHPVEVADTAWFVTRVDAEERAGRLQRVRLWLSDEREEVLDPETLEQSPDNVLYCRVRRDGWSVPCRFTAQQYHDLMLRAEGEGDAWYLPVGPGRYRPAAYERRPLPAT